MFVDGVLAGGLVNRTYTRDSAEKGKKPSCIGVDIRILRGEADADYGVYEQMRIEKGRHELSVACPDGRKIARNITVDAENYVGIDCMKGEISGRP